MWLSAERLGINAVPTLTINDKHLVNGAYEEEALEQLFAKP